MKFEYPQAWEKITLSEIELCTERRYDCFFIIGTGGSLNYSYIAMTEFPAENQSLETLAEYWFFRPHDSDATTIPAKEMKVDGARAICHEFDLRFPDDKRHFMVIHVMNGTTMLEIMVWAADEKTFNDRRDDIMKIIEGIDLKSV